MISQGHELEAPFIRSVDTVIVGSGAGGAVAATKLRTPEQESSAVLNDVAGQLGVTPERLSNAFKTALKNRIDQAVKDGHLTQAEATRMKAAIDRESVPMLGPGFRHGGPGFHREHHGLEAAAKGWEGDFGITIERSSTPLCVHLKAPVAGRFPAPTFVTAAQLALANVAYEARGDEATFRR
mgnify:CR=1 FL=1